MNATTQYRQSLRTLHNIATAIVRHTENELAANNDVAWDTAGSAAHAVESLRTPMHALGLIDDATLESESTVQFQIQFAS